MTNVWPIDVCRQIHYMPTNPWFSDIYINKFWIYWHASMGPTNTLILIMFLVDFGKKKSLILLILRFNYLLETRYISWLTICSWISDQVENHGISVDIMKGCIWKPWVERGNKLFGFGVELQNPLIHSLQAFTFFGFYSLGRNATQRTKTVDYHLSCI